MRHQTRKHSFSRSTDARKALLKGLVISLVEHGRIKTTLAKAKELRRHVEKAVTLGKKGDVATRRLLVARFGSPKTAETLVDDISKRFAKRPGGYTRVLKLGVRPGDKAPMAFIEFVDYKLPETAKAEKDTTVRGDAQATKKARTKNKVRKAAAKSVRRMKASSRQRNRR